MKSSNVNVHPDGLEVKSINTSLYFNQFCNTMKQNFLIGFAAGLLLFVLLNLIAAHLSSDCGLFAVFGLDVCADDIARAGWPLQFYETGGFAFQSNFNPLFLLIDMASGLGLALLSGWIYSRNKKTLSK